MEKVMDDFRTSAPEARGPPNPNVEYIPFDEMKERILKIVTGFKVHGHQTGTSALRPSNCNWNISSTSAPPQVCGCKTLK
ncbi:serine/threonine-protein phosphatase 4 regulatory subunit 2-like [Hylobates moloch]|uniref:serine/threonine-protein phosphatase 4 regulatory subunit 2-like n=1 Tax=Hylobates moloch TaxID=81572 RepID=UPI00267594CD|nr:serine/threonine-protein phosphatase 4 regulatory subunit 2-like [Hylobates moloch]